MTMKKTITLILIVCMILLSINVFSAVNIPKEYALSYSETPDEQFDATDLTKYGNVYSLYTGRNFPLPRYMPQYLELNGYLQNHSSMQQRVIGTYTPRYFDGDKFNNFITDMYSTYDLNETEKAYLDEASLTISPIKVSAGKCSYMAYWQNSRDFTEDYAIDSSKKLLDIWYFYDLGYWYVPEIRNAFELDCPFVYSDKHSPSKPATYYYEDNTYGYVWDRYVMSMCGKDQSYFSVPVDTAYTMGVNSRYNASSMTDLAVKLYNDKTLNTTLAKTLEGKCTVWNSYISAYEDYYCFPQSVMIEDIQRKDDWMMNVMGGTYMPKYLSYQGKTLDAYLSSTDAQFRDCKQKYFSSPLQAIKDYYIVGFTDMNGQAYKDFYNCQSYLQAKRKLLVQLNQDFTAGGVQNMIWTYFKNTYNIEKGTNLFPLNIVLSGIRCKQNDTWKQYKPTPISPNSQTPYVECNYTSSDPEVISVGYRFDIFVNPVFSMISGSQTIQDSYSLEMLKNLFLKYKIQLAQTNNQNVTQFTMNILNQSAGGSIVSSFSMNRSKENGCTFVFKTYDQANKTINQFNDLANKVQQDAEDKPAEIIRELQVQIRLLKSEVDKTDFFFYIDVIAKLVFRAFILFYYTISIIMFLYVIKLCILIPSTIIKVMQGIGTSKKHRQQHSILNK